MLIAYVLIVSIFNIFFSLFGPLLLTFAFCCTQARDTAGYGPDLEGDSSVFCADFTGQLLQLLRFLANSAQFACYLGSHSTQTN